MGLSSGLLCECCRPAAVVVDGFVDLGHEADGFGQGDDDFVVVGDVVRGEDPPFAVLEPFLADLVAADVKVPYLLGDRYQPKCSFKTLSISARTLIVS